VTVAQGSSWAGKADAASFTIKSGASANFLDGSKINGSLVAEQGAVLLEVTQQAPLEVTGDGVFHDGTLTGNLYFHGNLTLGALLSPGHSPGYANADGNFIINGAGVISPGGDGGESSGPVGDGARAKLEVGFGMSYPRVGGVDYDQINIGGNMEAGTDTDGILHVQLATLGARGAALGDDLDQVGLIRIGGTVEAGAGVEQVNRVTQNGHELRIVRRDNVALSSTTTVTGTGSPGITEAAFFNGPSSDSDGLMTVYGLDAFLQDETYGLTALTGLAHNAGVVTLGTFADRVGAQRKDGVWFRSGGAYADIDDEVDATQTIGFAEGGVDIVATDMFRLGVLASYGSSSGTVATQLGNSKVDGSTWSAGAEATFSAGGFYVDAVGQYGGSDWTILPVEAAGSTKVAGTTALAALEAGFTIGSEAGSITPWGQLVYQMTEFGDVESAWVDNVEFQNKDSMLVRGGVRVAGDFGGVKPYANVAVAQDVNEKKAVIVDGMQHQTGFGGPRVELGGGFSTQIGQNLTLSTDVSGTQGIGSTGITSYQGQVGLAGKW